MPRGNQKGGKKHKRGKKEYNESKTINLGDNLSNCDKSSSSCIVLLCAKM